jgi:hypothetical protein
MLAHLAAGHALDSLPTDLQSTRARYDDHTRWPDGFDPVRAGALKRGPPL